MDNIKTESIFHDIQYRLDRLKTQIPFLSDKRVVIYGSGINAQRVLDCLSEINIIGLMDAKYTGKFIFGKKVLSEEEVLLMRTEVILIAAEPHSTRIVYERIFVFCIQSNIQIMNMYGLDEMALHRNMIEQETNCFSLSRETLRNQIENNTAILFSFKGTLFNWRHDEEELYEIMEKRLEDEGVLLPNFKRNRILAQKKLPPGMSHSLRDIYIVFSTLTIVSDDELSKMIKLEEDVRVNNLLPRIEMIELVKYALNHNKMVYIVSETVDSDTVQRSALGKAGIADYKLILDDSNKQGNLLGRLIWAIGNEVGQNKVLFIGNNQNDNLIIPQLYGANIQLVQSSVSMFLKCNELQFDRDALSRNSDKDRIIELIVGAYSSPFICEKDVKKCDGAVGKIIGWREETEFDSKIELLPVLEDGKLEDVDELIFPQEENPVVSIIIPAYNQFGYTYNCLKSILLNTEKIPYEIILADDGSDDLTRRIEKKVTGITVLHNKENMRFLRNCNHAARKAKGKYIIFLNNDTQVQLNWLSPLVRKIEEPDVGLVGSKLVFPDGKLQEAGGIIWNDASAWNYGRGKNPDACEYNYVREADYISGASIMISKELWEKIGGFDERFSPAYCEDSDLAFAVRKHGKKVIYQPDSVVVHFEGISNGTSIDTGVKKYQADNMKKLYEKWKDVLLREQYPAGQNVLGACDRKGKKKTVLFISEAVPSYDKDAGSRTLDFYISEFLARGYIVKFIPGNFAGREPYTHRLRQMGVEVFTGGYYKKNLMKWLYKYRDDVDYAFLNYPNVSLKYIDILKELGIPIRYYGMDLHFLRKKREYELLGDSHDLELSREYYEMEACLMKKSDVIYYPSSAETEIVRHEFGRNDVKQLTAYIFDTEKMHNLYIPEQRKGIMFIGGYRHTPNVDAVLWFVNNIFPKIYEKENMPFYIAGVDMPPEIQNIKVPGTVILGALSDDELEAMYKKIKVIVAPLRYGAGVKGKIVEAMYHGIPVVTTSIGAEGIPNEGNALNIADDEAGLTNMVLELYRDSDRLLRCKEMNEKIIAKHFSRESAWNNICDDFK